MATAARKPTPARKPARTTNWFAIWVSTAVVVALVVIGGVVIWMNNSANSAASFNGTKPTGAHITAQGAIQFGKSDANVVTTYIDFLCPYCNQFEQSEGPTLHQLVDGGKIALEVLPMGYLDTRSNPAGYSSRAASAMYSVAIHDYSHSYAFMQALYADQPAEGSAGLSDQQIVDVAKQAGVNMTGELEREIEAHTYQKFAQATQLPQNATGTPTVLVNGKLINVTFNVQNDIVSNLK
jgi:protein-disulfide isomerase